MIELICKKESCRYCNKNKCENKKVKEEFKKITAVPKVILSDDSLPCKMYDKRTSNV